MRSIWAGVACASLLVGTAATAGADPGFLTPQAPFVTLAPGLPPGASVTAIISSGETVDGVRFQGIPDGIGIAPGAAPGTAEVFVAHEETTVPFRNTADFQDASVTRLTLDTTPGPTQGAVLAASVAIGPENGFLRFCSAEMVGPAEGFERYTFLVGEETNDVVDVPATAPFGADPGIAPRRQGGYQVVLDVETGEFTHVPGMGRLNHENAVALPGFNQLALLTTDDTFTATTSQLYLYLANQESHVWEDKGSLWAFQVTRTDDGAVDPYDPFNDANDYLDIQPGDDWQGRFIRVPKEIARGETELAPQDALEQWSNDNNVFQFVRLEDLAYDRNDPSVVYVADTGASRVQPDPVTGRMARPAGAGLADNGRIFRFEFDDHNPRKVTSFSVFADGDAPAAPEYVPFTSPDNVGISSNSLMIQEDTDEALVWRYDFASGVWSIVASVNDPDGESSGIVDASAWFGDGSWLLDVQGHGLYVESQPEPTGVLTKLESGQLLLMRIPGS